MNTFLIGLLFLSGVLLLYGMSYQVHKKYKKPYTMPIIVVSVIMISLLLLFNISYETFMIGGQWIEVFMGPAVVALAIPLYNHFEKLKQLIIPILVGTFIGAVTGILSGVLLAKSFGFERELILALAPKSVTTPVAVSITEAVGGPMSLAAVFVVIAGLGAPLFSSFVFKLFKITTPLGRGIGLGSASHAIGTATALERGQEDASFSTIAMGISAIIVSFLAPLFIAILL